MKQIPSNEPRPSPGPDRPALEAAPGRAGPGADRRPLRLAFVCVENSCRSQIAEGFARALGGPRVEVMSAGSRPSGRVNPKAVESMRARGIDLRGHRSKSVDELDGAFDAVVTMGCGDACPAVPAKHRLDWAIPDPKDLPPAEFNAVRDLVEARVRDLLEELS